MGRAHTITFTTKGQIVIPAPLRKKLGIEPGTRAFIEEHNGDLILRPITPAHVSSLRGKFSNLAVSTETLEKSRRADAAREFASSNA